MSKKQNIFREYNLWVVLVVVIVLIGIFFIRRDELLGFNPETDVCEVWQLDWDEHQLLSNDEYETYLRLQHPFLYNPEDWSIQWHCSEWRSKNKCELNPNDEKNCICDEYNDNVVGSWKQCFGETCIEGEIVLINEARVMINHHSNCAKAHEKNECERGNSRWTWDRSVYGDECDTEIINKTSILCLIPPSTVCRRKTLGDLDCDELKEELLNEGEDYCPKYHIWFFCGGVWRDNRYGTDNSLLVEYINRCA